MQGDPLPGEREKKREVILPPTELKQFFTMQAPNALTNELPWLAQSVMVDNYSATGYIYVRACKRYVPPGKVGIILHIPASRELNIEWQNPPNVGAAPTANDLAVITAFADLIPFSGGY